MITIKLKPKPCKVCKEKFKPSRSIQPCCSIKCAIELAKIQREKKEKSEIKEKHKEVKEKAKGLPWHKEKLQEKTNLIVRLIDYRQQCISCKANGDQAGHYHSVGAKSTLRYHLDNIHLQETSCNSYKGSNRTDYDLGLISVYGEKYQRFVSIEIVQKFGNKNMKLSIPEFKEKIEIANEIIKELESFKKLYPNGYSAEERLELRQVYNEQLGIYPAL